MEKSLHLYQNNCLNNQFMLLMTTTWAVIIAVISTFIITILLVGVAIKWAIESIFEAIWDWFVGLF